MFLSYPSRLIRVCPSRTITSRTVTCSFSFGVTKLDIRFPLIQSPFVQWSLSPGLIFAILFVFVFVFVVQFDRDGQQPHEERGDHRPDGIVVVLRRGQVEGKGQHHHRQYVHQPTHFSTCPVQIQHPCSHHRPSISTTTNAQVFLYHLYILVCNDALY